jgi:hypothetical protein
VLEVGREDSERDPELRRRREVFDFESQVKCIGTCPIEL